MSSVFQKDNGELPDAEAVSSLAGYFKRKNFETPVAVDPSDTIREFGQTFPAPSPTDVTSPFKGFDFALLFNPASAPTKEDKPSVTAHPEPIINPNNTVAEVMKQNYG